MSKLKALFSWSGEYLDQQFVATGDRNRGTGEIEFDLAEATVEQRRRIAALRKVDQVVDLREFGDAGKEYDAAPSLDQALDAYEAIKERDAERDAERRAAADKADADRAEHQRWLAEREAAADRERERRNVEKLAWVETHGSDRLQRAIKRGHDCQALYVRERAALDAPGFVADIYCNADWKSATCPSAEALDAADAAETLGLGEAEVVWLTSPAQDVKDGDCFEWSPSQAIVIAKYLGRYDLVRVI